MTNNLEERFEDCKAEGSPALYEYLIIDLMARIAELEGALRTIETLADMVGDTQIGSTTKQALEKKEG